MATDFPISKFAAIFRKKKEVELWRTMLIGHIYFNKKIDLLDFLVISQHHFAVAITQQIATPDHSLANECFPEFSWICMQLY